MKRNVVFCDGVEERLSETRQFAYDNDLTDNFEEQWSHLLDFGISFFAKPARVRISNDFYKNSFDFVIETQSKDGSWNFALNGALIYSEASKEWSIHT